jgi:hypothetical protein
MMRIIASIITILLIAGVHGQIGPSSICYTPLPPIEEEEVIEYYPATIASDEYPMIDNEDDYDPAICNGHGGCYNYTSSNGDSGQVCICYYKYAGRQCDYKRKSQLLVFLMSVFLGYLGTDRFLLGLIGLGLLKLLVTFLILITVSLNRWCKCHNVYSNSSAPHYKKIVISFDICLLMVIVAWWITDMIIIGLNNLNDSYGYKPYSML